MESDENYRMWSGVSQETDGYFRRDREAAYWSVMDRQESSIEEAVMAIRERFDYMEDRTPLEMYADSLMEERGMIGMGVMSPDIMAKLRVMQLRQIGMRDVVIVRDVKASLPSAPIEPLGPRDTLAVVQVGDVMWPVAYDDERSMKLTTEELYGKEVVVPDRVERDQVFVEWVDRAVRYVAERRLVKVAESPCKCKGQGLEATYTHLSLAQQAELGVISGKYQSRRFRDRCLCCVRSAYMADMHMDYANFSERLRSVFWMAEERAVRDLTRKDMRVPKTIRYASTNPYKLRAMDEVVQAELPDVVFEGHLRQDVEIQGTFGDIVRAKAALAGQGMMVDDAGFFDDTAFPGTVSKQVYAKRPYMFRGGHRAVVVVAIESPDGTVAGAGTQAFEAIYTGSSQNWGDLVYPEGVGGGPLGDMPHAYRVRGSARARAFRMLARKMGWIF